MFANRLQALDSRKGSSTSLWLTGIVVGGSVISLYYFHRLRRSAVLSQSSAEQSSSSDVLQRHELQVILVVRGESEFELQVRGWLEQRSDTPGPYYLTAL